MSKKDYWVTKDQEGYIDGWNEVEQSNTEKIEADPDLFNKFFCVKVENGVGVLDTTKKLALETDQIRQDAIPSTKQQIQDMQLALVQLSEEKETLKQQLIDTQLAMAEMYESTL
ncbi:hypothetical protein JH67_03085 [Listeria monocytogenes]|nr:hypothetical protein [Listeria monocytogenes]